jgi:PAS domain S-box-containing protein
MIPADAVPPTDDATSLSPEEVRRTLHELRVQQIELEQQNEELRRTQVELDASRSRYFDLYDLAPVGYVTLSEQGLILEANLTVASLLGVTRNELVRQPLSRFVFKDDSDSYYRQRKQLFESHEAQAYDVRMVKEDRTVFWAHFAAVVSEGAAGECVCRMTLSDITERKREERTLAQIRAAVEASSDAIGISDAQGHHVYQNKALSDLFGYATAEELEAAGGGPAVVKAPTVSRAMFDAILHGGSWVGELEMVTKSGRVFPAFERADAILDGAGEVVGVMGIITDMTERKEREDALRLFKELVQHSSDAIGMSTPEGRHYYQNDAFNSLFGEIGGRPHETVYVDAGVGNYVFDTIMGGRSWEGEVEMFGRDGTVLDIFLRAFAIKDQDGRVLGLVGLHTDITQRKRAEEALRESQRLLAETGQIGKVGGWEWDIATGQQTWTQAVYDIHEVDSTFRPTVDSGIGFYASASRPTIVRLVQRAIEHGEPFDAELEIVTAKGNCRSVHVIGRADLPRGRILGFFQDITQRKRAEAAKDALEEQLRQAQKMESIGRLAGGVAHDFNNMLGVILGHTEMAMDEIDPAKPLHASLEEIRKAATRSADLTRQLLAFARKQTVSPKMLDLNDTVANTLTMLGRLVGEGIRLTWEPGANVWPVKIDPSQVEQILANLCVNARDAIAGVGTITVATANIVDDADWTDVDDVVRGEYVRLTVSDTGCGMNAETLSHLFEPFFTTKEFGQGAGLGLSSVLGAVEQNGGVIKVRSELGAGTTFRIYLPRHVDQPEQTQSSGREGLAVRGHETILLVEDEPAILRLTTTMLERQGYTVLSAPNPSDAIRLATAHASEIHLLLTDVVMPDMNGAELSKQVESIHPHLKRLFMSGYTADVIAEHGLVDDDVCFIQKPFSTKDLAAKVREALGG